MMTLCEMLNNGVQFCGQCPFGFLDLGSSCPSFNDKSGVQTFLVELNKQCVSMLELL